MPRLGSILVPYFCFGKECVSFGAASPLRNPPVRMLAADILMFCNCFAGGDEYSPGVALRAASLSSISRLRVTYKTRRTGSSAGSWPHSECAQKIHETTVYRRSRQHNFHF